MKIVIFGGTGPTGRLLVQEALDAGHDVVVYARSPEKFGALHGRLQIVKGGLSDSAKIRETIKGTDAVISVLGPSATRTPGTPIADGLQNAVKAMKEFGVRRLVAICTPSASDPKDRFDLRFPPLVAIVRFLLPHAYREIQGIAKVVRDSALDWTLVRVTLINNGPVTPIRIGYLGSGSVGMWISRTTLAKFLLAQVNDSTWVCAAPAISGS